MSARRYRPDSLRRDFRSTFASVASVGVEEVGPITQQSDQAREIEAGDARALLAAGALLLDVREPEEVVEGHAAEAVFIPLGALGERLGELPEDRTVVVVCRSGGRSGVAAAALASAGYDALNLTGGMQAWREAGFPVVRADGSPGIVA